jgi:hypothetical protein
MADLDLSKLQQARLIPVTGIKGALDQERRAASALLAVMQGVPEITVALLKKHGAFSGSVATFIEPEFKIADRKIRPDGLIQISKGKRVWRALFEFKTGQNELELKQLNQYLDIAKQENFDALITVSNQVLNATGAHPTEGVDNRRLRSTALIHLSWLNVITECLILSEHTKVDDPDRAWILKELIRFLQSDASGASEFNDMGPNWVSVRENIKTGSIKKADDSVIDVVSKFQNLVRYCAFTLAAKTGVNASEVVPKSARTDGKRFLISEASKLIGEKIISGDIKIPGAAADLNIKADLGAGVLHCSFEIAAPSEGKNKTRLNWLLRQYKEAPKGARVAIGYKRSRSVEAPVSLAALKAGEVDLKLDGSREIGAFRLDIVRSFGTKRGRGQGAFIDSVLDQVIESYSELLQPVKAWTAAAPKLSGAVQDLLPELADDEIQGTQ